MSDVQLLLATIEDSKTSISKEELEKVHSQVSAVPSLEEGLFLGDSLGFSQTFREAEMWSHLAMGGKGQGVFTSVGWSQLLEGMSRLGLGQTD